MIIGEIVKLKGRTGHGKNRIREQGELWEVLALPTGVVCMDPPPVHPPLKGVMRGDERWFNPVDFEVVE
tara:strand:- start:1033 stop:1239 length:207 start_codon:yes stop_codon:yes gene_type:complete